MRQIPGLFVILPLLALMAACGPTSGSGGVLGFGPADWMEITYNYVQPGPDPVTIKYTETESAIAPSGYDPYVDADVETWYDPDQLLIEMSDDYLSGIYRNDLDIRLDEARLGTHAVPQDTVRVTLRYDGITYSGTGGTISITQLPDLGYIKGSFNITLVCSNPPCALASIVGEFSATRSI